MSEESKKNIKLLAPGSALAIKSGCRCPVLKNLHGRGAYQKRDGTPVFWYDSACPIHGQADDIDPGTELIEINLE